MTTDTKQPPQNIELHTDPNLKTIWVDNLFLAKRLDGISCVRLSANLPEGSYEQVRFMTSEQHLKEFINLLCLNLDYFPDKKSLKKTTISEKNSK